MNNHELADLQLRGNLGDKAGKSSAGVITRSTEAAREGHTKVN